MPSLPFGSTHGPTTSGVACHHCLWAAQTVERHPEWHAIIAFGLAHTVEWRRAWHAIIALCRKTRSNDIGRGMSSSPLGRTHGRTTSGVASHHRLKTAHTVERSQAWHVIIVFGKHTQLNDVGRGMPSNSLDGKHSQTTSGVACHHRHWEAHTVKRRQEWYATIAFGQHKQSNDVGGGMPSPPLDYTHGQTMLGVA